MIKLYNDDCFKIMQQLIDQNIKVDAIIVDPPYIINYTDWDKEFNMPLAIDLCYKLLKDNTFELVYSIVSPNLFI